MLSRGAERIARSAMNSGKIIIKKRQAKVTLRKKMKSFYFEKELTKGKTYIRCVMPLYGREIRTAGEEEFGGVRNVELQKNVEYRMIR